MPKIELEIPDCDIKPGYNVIGKMVSKQMLTLANSPFDDAYFYDDEYVYSFEMIISRMKVENIKAIHFLL